MQDICLRQQWRFCFIGGIALQRWGEPRTTVDVDLTILTGFGSEAPFVDTLLREFAPRISDARAFALEHRVVLLRSSSGIGIDVALGALAFEESAVDRASAFTFPPPPGITLRTCSAEDLIVMKAFAGRGQDWVDVERVVQRQVGKLDWTYIDSQLSPLATIKGEPHIVRRLEALRQASS